MSTDELVTHVVAGTAVIVALSHLLRAAARRLRQPAVIGQILAGLALGPSLLGRLPGGYMDRLFPREVLPYLSVVAQIALVPFLFAVACELDLRVLRQRRKVVPAVAACAFVIPMALGGGAAFLVAPLYTPPGGAATGNTGFVLFMAVAMAVTAVPVLASIIRERGAATSVPGVVSMTSAGIIDALGWIVLAAAVIAAGSPGQEHLSLPATVALFAAYMTAMVFLVRPALRRWLSRPEAVPGGDLPVVAALAMASAWATSALGLHVIFGAFVAGLVMPRGAGGEPDASLVRPLQDSGTILLPVFFMVSGLSVDIGALSGTDLALLGIFTVVATIGKIGGGYLGARLGGLPSRDATVVGVMLNTRGLTELIALNIGLQSGIIDQSLYTVLVIVALITTVATGPVLTLLRFPTPATSAVMPGLPAALPARPLAAPGPAPAPAPAAGPSRPRPDVTT
ncbi:cation:proton antiporter domain-containing protein [Yinghuangia soli]|uniref:Cation:proton antiporter n=1 Tax=Yinghuangia soli TaxID=2908204 RepID=A0AA41TZJ4_9ACTN|nr:cation:proton antiporter [Yinghuangia soli]MCF2528883.1 cation:proton antiporter [Yinghuangia soli]